MNRLLVVIGGVAGLIAIGVAALLAVHWPGTPDWMAGAFDMFARWGVLQVILIHPLSTCMIIGCALAGWCMWRATRVPTPFAAAFGRTFGDEPRGDGWRRAAVFCWCAAMLGVFAEWPRQLTMTFKYCSTAPSMTWPGNPQDTAFGLCWLVLYLLMLIAAAITAAVLLRHGFRACGRGLSGILLGIGIAFVDCLLLTAALLVAVFMHNP